MDRTEITQISGYLFKLRMNVNLVSNILGKWIEKLWHCLSVTDYPDLFLKDTPEIFWSEPSLQPLYKAIRGMFTEHVVKL
jgi:uncharacterized Rmd1/YagE family protein